MFHVSRLFLFFFISIYSPQVSSFSSSVRRCWGLFTFAVWVRRLPFAVCCSHLSFTVRIYRSSFAFADHRSVIIFSIFLSFIICVRSSIGVDLLCSRSCFAPPLLSRSCFAPPLLSRSGNITTILLLFVGFAAFAIDIPLFPIFARLGCFRKYFRVGCFCKDFKVGYSLPITLTFISQPCPSCNIPNAYWLKVSVGSEKNQ